MGVHTIHAGHAIPDDIHVVIEIPAHGGPVKYEIDKDSGAIFVDRFLTTSMHYPGHYGYIPKTLAEDGDPVDVLVLAPFNLICGCVVRCRPVGMLGMEDEAGIDHKILAVPVDHITRHYRAIQNYDDLPASLLRTIAHFFEHYKDLNANKWVKLQGWEDVKAARQEIIESVKRFEAQS